MDSEFLQWFATLGVGGILAGFMFVFYRKDVKSYTDLWKIQSDKMESLVTTVLAVVKENTISNTKLITLIETMERNAMRVADVEEIVNRKFKEKL